MSLKEMKIELDQLAALDRLQTIIARGDREPAHVVFRGKKVIDFTCWDSFGLNYSTKIKRAAQKEIEVNGIGSASSRLSTGTSSAHIVCEKRVAKFLGMESALLVSSLNQAVLTLLSSAIGEKDCVIVDEEIQTPAIDVAYLVHADVINFDSRNPDSLARVLEQTKHYKRKYLFVEAISPTHGSRINLSYISEMCAKFSVQLIVDESFSLGIEGLRGAGGVEHANVKETTFCQIGSLGHSLASYGAFIAGPQILIDYLINRSKTFSTEPALPAALASQVETAINIVELQTAAREHIRSLAVELRAKLSALQLRVTKSLNTPIVSFRKPTRAEALFFAEGLFQRGFYCDVLPCSSVRDEGYALRFLINSAHSPEMIKQLVQSCTDIEAKLKNA